MSKETTNFKQDATASHFPEHGPLDENGREILLQLRHVDINFGKGDHIVRAARDVTFDVYKGETFSFVGESGSGKTTVGRAIIRANTCSNGEILYKGVRISGKIPHSLDREVIRNIQMVFQDPASSLNERATVDQIISEGLNNFHLYANEAERVKKVEGIVKDVGLLPEHLTRYPHEFSGGQRQRVGLARAMVMEPELVIADEPISALDVSIRAQILNLMNKFKRERNTTCFFIAHDLSIVRYISDRIGVIYKGRVVEIADAEELFNYPLHPYTRSLISAIPLPDPRLEKAKVLCTYEPKVYGDDEVTSMKCIGHGHYVFGTDEEIEVYRTMRESGEPIHSIMIDESAAAGTDETETVPVASVEINSVDERAGGKLIRHRAAAEISKHDVILDRPVHDTGSVWWTVLSFLLPLLGVIGGLLFRKFNYIRNYKSCKKGWVAGFICIGLFILMYLFFIFMALK